MVEDALNIFYVYEHVIKDTSEVFYVGKGKNNRAWDKKGRNTYWKNIVNKHSYEINILFSELSESEAFDKEAELILKLKPKANLTLGYEGRTGWVPTEEEKLLRKIKSIQYWENNPHKVEERRLLYSKEKNPFYGKTHSEQVKEKLKKFHYSPILCIDLSTGKNYVVSGTRKASELTKIPRQTIMRLLKSPNKRQRVLWKFERLPKQE